MNKVRLKSDDALLIVDVQNDFLQGGALPVPAGDEVIPVLNRYIALFQECALPIIATRDWHPRNHCSFKVEGGAWPVHCVAGTDGAAFSEILRLPIDVKIISKDVEVNQNTYSGFQETDLAMQLQEQGVKRLFIGGIATDYCVLHTVLDALEAGFKVMLLIDAIRAVNVQPEDGNRAMEQMTKRGAESLRLADLER